MTVYNFQCGTCDCTCNCQPECDNINCCCFTIGVKGATTSQPQPTWGYGGQQGWGYPGPSMSGTQGMPWGTGAPGAAGGPSISATTMAPYGNTFMASSLAQYPTPSPQYSPLATTGPPPMSPQVPPWGPEAPSLSRSMDRSPRPAQPSPS